MSSEISSIDLWTGRFLSRMYMTSPKARPSAHPPRPAIKRILPDRPPSPSKGISRLGIRRSASLAKASPAKKNNVSSENIAHVERARANRPMALIKALAFIGKASEYCAPASRNPTGDKSRGLALAERPRVTKWRAGGLPRTRRAPVEGKGSLSPTSYRGNGARNLAQGKAWRNASFRNEKSEWIQVDRGLF